MEYIKQQIQDHEYGIGCIIKRKGSLFADQCGVVIGWDSWLRPLVLVITQKSKEAAVHLSILTLDEFEAESGSKVVFSAGGIDPQCREESLTDALWRRAQQLLRTGLSSCDLTNLGCEDIARFVVMGISPAFEPRSRAGACDSVLASSEH